jgi:Major Facilitator Superfamily
LAGRYSIVAELLPPEDLLAGNSLLTTIDSVAYIIGPAIAGALIMISNASIAIGIDALSYGILALTLRSTRRCFQKNIPHMAARTASASGMRQIFENPVLIRLLPLSFMFNLLFGPVAVALPLYVAEDLHRGAEMLGLFWTVFGIGAVVGGLLAGMLRRVPILSAMLMVASWAVSLLPLGLFDIAPVSLLFFAICGFVYAPYPVLAKTLIQKNSPPGSLAAVGAAWSSIIILSHPLGTVFGGLFVAAMNPQGAIVLSALSTGALAVVGFGILLRSPRVNINI